MNQPRRLPRRHVDGVVLLDKPHGLSSNAALQRVRRAFHAEKAGHTGTLDPMATGLLPICLGEATKFSSQLLDADKRYLATVKLGIDTDTGDAEGAIVRRRPVTCSRDDVPRVSAQFRGPIKQIPPMYSALKRDGKPLYEYARAGVEIERAERHVTIHRLDIEMRADDEFVMDVACSKGTYIRTLAMDIGNALGCGAHLIALRRTAIADFRVEDALSLAEIEASSVPGVDRWLLPADYLLTAMPAVQIDAEQMQRLLHGQRVSGAFAVATADLCRVYGPAHCFLGLARRVGTMLEPQRLVATYDKSVMAR